jgi:hypothetical protein
MSADNVGFLVVGRVIGVQKEERVPEASLSWKAETWAMTAEVEVLRSYIGSGERPVNRIHVDSTLALSRGL